MSGKKMQQEGDNEKKLDEGDFPSLVDGTFKSVNLNKTTSEYPGTSHIPCI
ncbi:MAG: hypothetical protein ACTSUE_16900 [Promethearchaeota archaeon]